MRRFKNDKRILCWELYNEPGRGSLEKGAKDANRRNKSSKLIQASWEWAREINPSQPITSTTEGALGNKNIYINRINCDIHSIHNYQKPEDMANLIRAYKMDGRPILVTEWLARTRNSNVENILPLLKENNVGAINWGFVSGKTGTIWPWDSKKDSTGTQFNMHEMRKAGKVIREGEAFPEPELWFHDLFRTDGSAFDDKEIETFKNLTKENKPMIFN